MNFVGDDLPLHIPDILFYNSVPDLTKFEICYIKALNHSSQYALSVALENIIKPCSFLMFSRGRKRVHWEQMG